MRLATPVALVPRGQQLRSQLRGVLENQLRSPDALDPDGLILARTDDSRRLVGNQLGRQRRITRRGIAEITNLASSQLIQLPIVPYRDAVSAPFVDAGYQLTPSDKGRYQQRALELAKGLVYLAWLLRQSESNRLLELFFTYHGAGNPPPEYRRAVTYLELRAQLLSVLRERRARLRAASTAKADAWLQAWSDGLLERGLMLGGYVLACSECAKRAWYDAELVTNRFRCGRCAHESIVPSRAVRSFRLNEAFYQFKQHQGQVVTLVLALLRSEAKESFLYLPETSLDDGVRPREIDAAALVDGKLIIVEAKSTDVLSQADVARYRYLARRTHAWRLVFATTEPAWNAATTDRIEAARDELAESGVEVVSLHKGEILESPPPQELELFVRHPQ